MRKTITLKTIKCFLFCLAGVVLVKTAVYYYNHHKGEKHVNNTYIQAKTDSVAIKDSLNSDKLKKSIRSLELHPVKAR